MPNVTIPEAFADNPIGYAIANLAPECTGALYAFSTAVYQHSSLPLREFEAARARVALINGCQVCRKFRSAEDVPTYLAGLGEDPARGVHVNGPAPDEGLYADIADCRNSSAYSERERLVIQFAERYSTAPAELGSDILFWEQMRTKFSEAELVDLTLAVTAFVAAGRFVHVLGLDEQAACAIQVPAA